MSQQQFNTGRYGKTGRVRWAAHEKEFMMKIFQIEPHPDRKTIEKIANRFDTTVSKPNSN